MRPMKRNSKKIGRWEKKSQSKPLRIQARATQVMLNRILSSFDGWGPCHRDDHRAVRDRFLERVLVRLVSVR